VYIVTHSYYGQARAILFFMVWLI